MLLAECVLISLIFLLIAENSQANPILSCPNRNLLPISLLLNLSPTLSVQKPSENDLV